MPEIASDTATIWFLVAGAVLVAMALAASTLYRLPMTTAMFYLALGAALGPWGLGLLRVDPVLQAALVERVTEVAVLVSLFTAGLKLRVAWRDRRWLLPLRLATVSMAVTVALATLLGVVFMGLPLGAAVLLGGIVAPTDPVLASDVQVTDPRDRDIVRFGLTGEAGLNDGAAFPVVMLGLGLLGLHDLGPWGLRWLAVDVLWATAAGLGVGALLGTLVGRLVLRLRERGRETAGLDDFLTLGLIALSYGTALLVAGYGFLAVFAAGAALGRIERQERARPAGAEDPRPAAELADSVLGFNEQLERIGEVAVVVLVGAMLARADVPPAAWWFVPALLLLVRPASVALGTVGLELAPVQRRLVGWFGVRGIGSLYYLAFATAHGLPEGLARRLAGLALATVAVSAVVHGVSVTPLMTWYEARRPFRRRVPAASGGVVRRSG